MKLSSKINKSSAIAALSFFLVLNIVLALSQPFKFDKYEFPYQGWAWWVMKDLRQDTNTYNVAFLGSSLTVASLNTADATHYKENLDLTEYHKCRLLDETLKKEIGGNFKTFNLSGPGQMPSDAYLSLQAMVNLGKTPQIVFYGVAPRDFIDSELSGPQDTEPFRYLNRVVELNDSEKMVFRSPLDKINRALENNTYFYKNAIDLQMSISSIYESLIDKVAPVKAADRFTFWDRKKLLPEYKKGEFHKFAHMCNPEDLSKSSEYIDNSIEYIHRYKKPNITAFKTQMYFMNKIANYCDQHGIKLIVINMPITQDNLKLLKKEHYNYFLDKMISFADKTNTHFFDLNDHSVFIKEDFHDGVHMNARGGIKFIEKLARAIKQSRKTNEIVYSAGQNLKVANQKSIDESSM